MGPTFQSQIAFKELNEFKCDWDLVILKCNKLLRWELTLVWYRYVITPIMRCEIKLFITHS